MDTMAALRFPSIFHIFEAQKHNFFTEFLHEDMSTNDNSSIQRQKSDVFNPLNALKLHSSCVPGNGIISLSEADKKRLKEVFESSDESKSFFVPASGSGSRMFSEIVRFVETGESSDKIEEFFKKLPELALFQELPLIVREKIGQLQPQYIAEYLISEDGMNFPERPKGLIPFHVFGDRIFNPFQEQYQQALEILEKDRKIHFTIQPGFEQKIRDSLGQLNRSDLDENVSFSVQDTDTDAVCFEQDGSVVLKDGEPLRRPAGHGALLQNLNAMDEDLILIKNIDNVQHWSKSDLNREVWKQCTGLLIEFKRELKALKDHYSTEKLKELNAKYQFLSEKEVEDCDAMQIRNYASRPSRVCGMVVNEGAPGGGPYWVEENGSVTKQIVEKVQVSDEDKCIMEQSSHFNPVFIALSKSDVDGNPLDLNRFVDHSKYLVVTKPFEAREIKFRELPGLWNGSMSNWNTVFVEIPAGVFSPVKSLFDLLEEAHQA